MSPTNQASPAQLTAAVAGATGAVAKRLIEVLASDPRWNFIGLSRNAPASSARMRHVPVDLLDPADCRRRIEPFRGVTHLFYCARAKHGEGGIESVEENVAMPCATRWSTAHEACATQLPALDGEGSPPPSRPRGDLQ